MGNGSGILFIGAATVSVGDQPIGIAVGDFNNDGNQDFATTNFNPSTSSIRLGNGAGGFSGTTEISIGGVKRPFSIAVGNFNNDAFQDFATANSNDSSVSIRIGDGTGNFNSSIPDVSVGIFNGPRSIAIGDFNNDGFQDFATANPGASTVSVRLGDGAGNFSGTTTSVSSPQSVAIGDFNRDGNQDFATVGNSLNSASIRLGDGLGNFSGTTEVSVDINPRSIVIGDFNNDGSQDFASANNSGSLSIRLGGCSVISGRVTYANALTTTGVPSTTINAAGSIPLSTSTDSNGNYSLSGFGSGAYTITPSKANQVNGISNLDASTVAQHVAGIITLNATQQIAADTSGNGSISALDAAFIAQFVAAIANPSITGTWKFIPPNRSYPSVMPNQVNQDYSAILVGEVTGNWNPAGALRFDLSNWNPTEPLRFDLSTVESEQPRKDEKAAKEVVTVIAQRSQVSEKEMALTVDLTATATTGAGILGYQFDVLYDKEVIEPQAISCDVADTISRGMTAICRASEPGVLKVVVFGAMPMSGEGILLKLKFNVVGARGSALPLRIENFIFNEDSPQEVMIDGQVLVGDWRIETISIGRELFTADGEPRR